MDISETAAASGLKINKQVAQGQRFSPESHFTKCLRAASSVVRGRIWLNFKILQPLMYVIITYKNEKDPIKNREKVAKPFF